MTDPRACARLPERLLANCRVLSDRMSILPLLPKGRVIAEVGVAFGDFSQEMIGICQPGRFIGIDSFTLHELPAVWGKPRQETFGELTHEQYYRRRFAEPIRRGVMEVLAGDSCDALARLPDRSVDIFYVDADHSYESVRGELSIIKHKIRPDGLIILNDYIMNEAEFSHHPYGVIQATNEFMIAEDWEMIYFAFQFYMYCDVVLRKAAPVR